MKIAVYGATGFTGRLVAAELARRDIEPVLAGRDIERLRQAAGKAGISGADLRQADLGAPESIVNAFHGCDAVINCVAPFRSFGEPVVRAAISARCHYLDTTGEQLYMKHIFDTCADDAERAGVSVVPAVTDDGLPGDLIAHLAAEQIGQADEIVEDITVADLRQGAGASRGTARSALANIETFADGGLIYEDGRWRMGAPVRHAPITPPGSSSEIPVLRSPLPSVVTVPRHTSARRVVSVLRTETAALLTAITPELVNTMPEGPTDDARRAARWTMTAQATSSSTGRSVRGLVQGTDGYGSTARIAVEAARRLADHGARPGILAPAHAFDPADFLNTLGPHGVRWTVENAVPA